MRTRRGEGEYAHPPTEIGSSTPSGLTTMRRSTDDAFWPWMLSSSSNITPGVDDPQAALELDRLQLVRVSRLRGNGAHLHNDAHVIKEGKNYCYLARRRTLARLNVLIRLLLPTFGKPTTPTVTFCDALGLYALRRRSNAGAVPDARFVR